MGVAFAFGLLDERRTAEAQRLANKAHAAVRAEHWAEAAEWRSAMEDLVKTLGGTRLLSSEAALSRWNVSLINPYDVRTTVQYSWDAMQKFFDQNSTKDLLHIPRALHFGTAPEDGVVSNEAWIRSLNWTGAEEFLSNERRVWRRPDEQIAGYWKSFKNLEQVVVLGAGHMVPMNQPLPWGGTEAKEAEFIFPLDWQQSRISDGAFTVESDREEVVKLGEMALKSKLDHLKSHGRLTHYRFYLAWRAKLLNQDWRQKGMTGMCCAVMAGDTKIIRQLVEHRADANARLSGMGDMGYYDTQTVLMMAAKESRIFWCGGWKVHLSMCYFA
eukprot:g7387.t1